MLAIVGNMLSLPRAWQGTTGKTLFTYPCQQLVCIFEILEQYRDLVLVCTPFHVLAEVPLNALHADAATSRACRGCNADTGRYNGSRGF